MENTIICKDALLALKEMPDESINCVVTSPPYWQLRDYGVSDQIGREESVDKYVENLIIIFNEVKRVLRSDGTCFVVIDDTYKKKTLSMAPYKFAIRMVETGWLCRNTIIWHKTNAIPESVTDRFTADFEYVYFFTKSKKYYFKQQFQPLSKSTYERSKYLTSNSNKAITNIYSGFTNEKIIKFREKVTNNTITGRNMRTVWSVACQPFREAHFATFPPNLIIPMIKAGCPEFVCVKCGKPKEIIIKREYVGSSVKRGAIDIGGNVYCLPKEFAKKEYAGYTDCGCGAEFKSGIVLDPFAGAGTTCVVAKNLGRRYIGIEINPEYCEMINKRLNTETIKLDL